MAIETLRPNAAGDETSIPYQSPASTAHWDKVDEAVADDSTTFLYEGTSTHRDLYNLPASSGSGTINFIKIYIRCESSGEVLRDAYPSLKSGSTVTDGTKIDLTSSWVTYSEQWSINPDDSAAWEWADIDALQIGVKLTGGRGDTASCTQVYVEVDYTEQTRHPRHAFVNFQGPGIF